MPSAWPSYHWSQRLKEYQERHTTRTKLKATKSEYPCLHSSMTCNGQIITQPNDGTYVTLTPTSETSSCYRLGVLPCKQSLVDDSSYSLSQWLPDLLAISPGSHRCQDTRSVFISRAPDLESIADTNGRDFCLHTPVMLYTASPQSYITTAYFHFSFTVKRPFPSLNLHYHLLNFSNNEVRSSIHPSFLLFLLPCVLASSHLLLG